MVNAMVENPIVGKSRKKVAVVMGATGSGKSRLALDLASVFPAEIINADSMQVYEGLDVLTNKVPLEERKGIPHHLLGSVSASVEFTAKDFRDLAIPIIDDILARNCLPIIVGGTNYYIQALVSPFLADDLTKESEESSSNATIESPQLVLEYMQEGDISNFELLKEIDPCAANRIHPNDSRKVNRYLSLYSNTGVLPSKLFQGKSSEKWGRVDNFRYDCTFIWVDASLSVLDKYVEQRVDSMMDAGLLNEVYNIYNPNADYCRGLHQAIGVREFKDVLRGCFSTTETSHSQIKSNVTYLKPSSSPCNLEPNNVKSILDTVCKMNKELLMEAINKLKTSNRRLVRQQKRRLNRLKTYFGWDLHLFDATEAIHYNSDDLWAQHVVEPCVDLISRFLDERACPATGSEIGPSRDLWTQYCCEACGNRILRGAHEWKQHVQGRNHRKRILSLKKKSQNPSSKGDRI